MNIRFGRKELLLTGVALVWVFHAVAQNASSRFNNSSSEPQSISYDSQGRPLAKSNGSSRKDSLQHRDRYADSITIFYRYYDSTRNRTLDSSLNEFSNKLPQPYWYTNLGNFGTATRSFIFSPIMKAGWDAGFHQYDVYNYKIEDTRFFTTTRPFTELAYLLGNKAEQFINVLHTQNRKSNFNFSFEYRFSNSPGLYKTQNASISDMRFTTHYQSPNKRYESFLIFLSNKNSSSENGGLRDLKQIDSLALNDPFELNTRLGATTLASRNPFNTSVNTGNIYKENTFLYRHQYDFGQKDSLVTDSVTYKLFYARLRIQHTLSIRSNNYQFLDKSVDSTAYQTYFNKTIHPTDTLRYTDAWTVVTNELSAVSFPEKNNQSQFLKAGVALQNIKGTFNDTVSHNFYNVYVLGEYRNRTRNQKWDIEANGQLYLNGLNSGDYAALVSLKRQISKSIGYLQLGFQNTNRTPSFIFDPLTSFPIKNKQSFNKENITRAFVDYENPRKNFRLSGEYYLVSNYTYFDSFFVAKQEAVLFNMLHVSAEKKFKLSKHWSWYAEVHLQQATGDAPVHVPFLLTRNRLAFEGNFYKNLFLSTGVELRYYSDYKADNYSPFLGQFFYQNTYTTSNRPDINLFFHFRIRSFKSFVRLENINALNTSQGFKFNKYNFAAQQYPMQGLWFRFGVWWNFVN
jgi:hypothetical protein